MLGILSGQNRSPVPDGINKICLSLTVAPQQLDEFPGELSVVRRCKHTAPGLRASDQPGIDTQRFDSIRFPVAGSAGRELLNPLGGAIDRRSREPALTVGGIVSLARVDGQFNTETHLIERLANVLTKLPEIRLLFLPVPLLCRRDHVQTIRQPGLRVSVKAKQRQDAVQPVRVSSADVLMQPR